MLVQKPQSRPRGGPSKLAAAVLAGVGDAEEDDWGEPGDSAGSGGSRDLGETGGSGEWGGVEDGWAG